MSGLQQLVLSGPLILAIPVAAAAGAVTFISPCCLPLVPGYLSYVTGMAGAGAASPAINERAGAAPQAAAATSVANTTVRTGTSGTSGTIVGTSTTGTTGTTVTAGTTVAVATEAATAPASGPPRGRTVAGTALFVLGFSFVFATYGAAAGGLGALLTQHQRGLIQGLGALTIVLGLLFAGALDRFSFAGRIIRPSFRPRAGLAGAPLLGVLFGFGWAPCIGPTLSTVLTLSAASGTASRGAFLAFVYGLGLGIPFLLMALALQRTVTAVGFFRRHAKAISQIGGAMLIVVGILELTGAWTDALNWLRDHWVNSYQSPL